MALPRRQPLAAHPVTSPGPSAAVSAARGRPLSPSVGVLGQAVRRRRLAGGWSITAFADRVGISPSYVSLLERGQRRPTLGVYQRLESALEGSA